MSARVTPFCSHGLRRRCRSVARCGVDWLHRLGGRKMVDTRRRPTSPPASALALLAGWLLPRHAALIWTAFVVSTIALPTLLPVLAAIVPRRAGINARSHLRALRKDAALAASQFALLIVLLAHQAWLMVDAIGRTLVRLLVTRRNLF